MSQDPRPTSRARFAFAPFALLVAACASDAADAAGGEAGAGETDPAAVTTVPLRRLSRQEYASTIRDLVAIAVPAEASAIVATLEPVLARMPEDARIPGEGEPHGGFRRLDQALQQSHADIAYAVAEEVGRAFTSSPDRVAAVFGSCLADVDPGNDAACVGSFLKGYGERVLRRPVTDEDVAFYSRPLGGASVSPEGLADVVALLFSAPDVLYLVERASGATEASRRLTAYELASRLSYHFVGTMPDEALFAQARSGELTQDEVYARAVDRLAADPRASKTVAQFFSEWLRLEELERLDTRNGDPIFDAFVAGETPTATLREEMFADVTDAAAWVTSHGGTLADFVRNRQSFARTPALARIYGVPVWDGTSEPPTFQEPARAGLVTRAAFVASGSANTRPIMKGVRLRMGLLCDSVPPPPAAAQATHVELSPTLTTRQVVEQLTEGEGSSCAGCHATSLNPLGFATESFDALGRFRSSQRLFDRFGNVIGERKVSTQSTPRVLMRDLRVAEGPEDLTRYLVESKKVEACFARNYFRFAFVRNETEADEPLIDRIAAETTGKSLAEVMKSVALRPEFRSKTLPKEGS